MSFSREIINFKKLMPLYLHVWYMLIILRYSSIRDSLKKARFLFLCVANNLIACSTALLFQQTLS